MSILLWIIFGAFIGWVASLIMRTDEDQGALGNIIIGIIGAFIGGAISRALGGSGVNGFNLGSIVMAIAGACLLILFIRMITGRTRGSTIPR